LLVGLRLHTFLQAFPIILNIVIDKKKNYHHDHAIIQIQKHYLLSSCESRTARSHYFVVVAEQWLTRIRTSSRIHPSITALGGRFDICVERHHPAYLRKRSQSIDRSIDRSKAHETIERVSSPSWNHKQPAPLTSLQETESKES
jgi:hypothetical protein